MPTPIRRRALRIGAPAIAAVAAVLLFAAPAFAHIDPDPSQVTAGTQATINFGVEHGCSGSPTTKLVMQLPPGLGAPAAASTAAGWTGTIANNIVTWTGPAEPGEFKVSITATMPTTPGDIRFPIVQSCEVGQTSWIEQDTGNESETAHPAPTVKVVANPDAPATSNPATTAPTSAKPSVTVAAPAHAKKHNDTTRNVALIVAGLAICLGAGIFIGVAHNKRRAQG